MRDICFNRLSVHQSIRYVGINVQTVRWGGGTGIGVAFEHCLCTFCGDFEQKNLPKPRFCYPQKGIFYHICSTIFQSQGSAVNLTKQNPKNSTVVPMPLSSSPPHLRPNIDTCITQTVLSTFEVATCILTDPSLGSSTAFLSLSCWKFLGQLSG